MNKSLEQLLARGRMVSMSANDKERQRQSFAYGTTKIENDRITRETLHEALKREKLSDDKR